LKAPENKTAFPNVLEAEQKKIAEGRKRRRELWRENPEAPQDHDAQLNAVGLAFSGGGIRSATFNLGVLQALAELGLLRTIDYLSTVSGGGYVGAWFVAWIKRKGIRTVEENLKTQCSKTGRSNRPSEIEYLRRYSNYLTPKLGAFSGDTWAFIGSYTRNLILNQLVLGLFLVSLLLLSRPFLMWFWIIVVRSEIAAAHGSAWKTPPLIAVSLLGIALTTTVANLSTMIRSREHDASSRRLFASSLQVNIFVLFPIEAAVWILWAWYWGSRKLLLREGLVTRTCVFTASAFVLLWMIGLLGGKVVRRFVKWIQRAGEEGLYTTMSKKIEWPRVPSRMEVLKRRDTVIDGAAIMFWAIWAGAVIGLLAQVLVKTLELWIDPLNPPPEWHVASWGFIFAMFVFLLGQTLHIGLMGSGFNDDAREWWGRCLGMLARLTICLTLFYVVSIDGPWFVEKLETYGSGHGYYKWALTSLWALITGAGIAVGKKPLKPPTGLRISPAIIMKIAPPVFVVGLLIILSSWTNVAVEWLHHGFARLPNSLIGWAEWFQAWPHYSPEYWQFWNRFEHGVDGYAWALIFGLAGLSLLLSNRVGINRFSMHALYRNRLVRCYLGATRDHRNPHPFTGFDPDDDSIQLEELDPSRGYSGPYLIVNTALNLVSGTNLAWQQRKAAAFMFTPDFCGFEIDRIEGGRLSAFSKITDYRKPPTLGRTIAISGAAASPNMGFHSSSALAFLMTVFNVRLGQWIGNPRYQSSGARNGPGWGLAYLLSELLGQTDDQRKYVYVSDGGHFENLGIYELVRRRCRFIIACDAGEDHALKFGDIGNAIEKCRSDFGVDIEIDIDRLRTKKDTGKSGCHCSIGTIHYERIDPSLTSGTLVYLKASLTGDEPTDVQRYAAQFPAFPHQTTADQWFTESQFESYRALGQHVGHSTFSVIGEQKAINKMNVEEFFVKLKQQWYLPSPFVQTSFTKHSATYCSLMNKLRTEKSLQFLDRQVYPQWPSLVPEAGERTTDSMWLPSSNEDRRAGFYFCLEVIQLMEDAYIDLNLETQFEHPDNRGWANFFRHWSWSGMFCATWAISASIYGTRFQNFCERQLDLYPGKVLSGEPVSLRPFSEGKQSAIAYAKKLQRIEGLDAWETKLVIAFLAEGLPKITKNLAFTVEDLELLPIRVRLRELKSIEDEPLTFNIGFAVGQFSNAAPNPTISYFRIQNHVRKMGLARQALNDIMKKYSGLTNEVREAAAFDPESSPGGRDVGKIRISKLEAIPTTEAVDNFRKIFNSVKFRQVPNIGE
jgi:hypothetical protein